ncbi:ABC transporter substrate-binding protein [Pseudonocardia sp. NPDC049635]|uniref:ABC transporter substrate-binding protein n=1 Tax=Pseudonocardia sp. NPDC049635 TaxID=3155506 RepID=UPI0033DDECCF
MKQGKLIAMGLLTGVVALTSACGSSDGSSGGAASDDSLSLGVIIDQTGVFSSTGLPALNGIQLAVDQVNEAGGIDGKEVELLIEDGTSDPTVAAAVARTLSRKVPAVIGTSVGAGCRAVQPILDAAKVFQYCLSPQQIDHTPLFFSALAPVADYVPATIPWLKDQGIERIAYIGQNDATGDGYLSVFSYIAQTDPTFEVVAEERFDSGATNLETHLTKIRDANPDLIATGTSGANIVPIVRAIKALGMTQPVWVGTGSATIEALSPLASDLPAGGLFANAFWADISAEVPSSVPYAEEVTSFSEAYSAEYGEPVSSAAGAYDATMQVLEALKSGAATGEEIAANVESTAFTGVLGDYAFSPESHQGATLPPVMMTYEGGETFKLAFAGS